MGAPAFAAPGDFGTSLTNVNEAVMAGSSIGIGISVANVPTGVTDVPVGLRVETSASSGFDGEAAQATVQADGTASTYLWDGDVIAQLPDAGGYPMYSAFAHYDVTLDCFSTRVFTDVDVAIPVVEALQLTVTPTQFTTDGTFVGTLVPEGKPEVTAENSWQYFAYASALRVANDPASWVGSNAEELTAVEAVAKAPPKPVAVETGVL